LFVASISSTSAPSSASIVAASVYCASYARDRSSCARIASSIARRSAASADALDPAETRTKMSRATSASVIPSGSTGCSLSTR